MKISLFYDHVTVLDYAYLDDHQGVVGDSLVVDVEFIGETDDEGVVYDFSYAKKKVKEIIDRDCDHRLVVPKSIAATNDGISTFSYPFGFKESVIDYKCPEEGLCVIPYANVSEHTLVSYLEAQVLKEMPNTVKAVKLKLRKEELNDESSFFHYTHGLKDHYGNCQRLLHGHRSTVKVFINSERNYEYEKHLAKELFKSNVHFCYWENVVNKKEISESLNSEYPEGRFENLIDVKIAYESSQGKFESTIPGDQIYLMQSETTVENLSIHFAKVIKSMVKKTDIVEVHAFEGIAKGAITTI